MKKDRTREGQIVRVIDGALTGFRGEVKELNAERSTAKVDVQAFGRTASMDYTIDQIERVTDN